MVHDDRTDHPSAIDRQPPPAERARSITARPTGALLASGVGDHPILAATTTVDGAVLVVVPSDSEPVAALWHSPLGDLPARLTFTDRATFPLRHPVRAHLELAGWLIPVAPDEERALVLAFAEAFPHACLFDVGQDATLLRLELAEALLEEAGSTVEVDPEEFDRARPDPISLAEDDLMVAARHGLSRLSARVQHWAGRDDDVRLLGLDRFGVRFRVQTDTTCYDLRVPFARPLGGPADLAAAVDQLLSCGPA